MKKTILAGMLAMVMLLTVLGAGCTSPTTTSPTPTTGTSTTVVSGNQSVIQYLGTTMQQMGFNVTTPFAPQQSPQSGVAAYNGTVQDANGTYVVSVQSCNNASTAQARYLAMQNAFMGQGYTTLQQNTTMWAGYITNTQRGAALSYGTSQLMPYYCMVITGNTTGQMPYQQAAWMGMWNHMNGYYVNGYGMGPHMGYGMNPSMRNHMQQEMQEHMGYRGMMGRGTIGGNTT